MNDSLYTSLYSAGWKDRSINYMNWLIARAYLFYQKPPRLRWCLPHFLHDAVHIHFQCGTVSQKHWRAYLKLQLWRPSLRLRGDGLSFDFDFDWPHGGIASTRLRLDLHVTKTGGREAGRGEGLLLLLILLVLLELGWGLGRCGCSSRRAGSIQVHIEQVGTVQPAIMQGQWLAAQGPPAIGHWGGRGKDQRGVHAHLRQWTGGRQHGVQADVAEAEGTVESLELRHSLHGALLASPWGGRHALLKQEIVQRRQVAKVYHGAPRAVHTGWRIHPWEPPYPTA